MWRKEDVVRHETYIMGLLPEFQANKIPASTVLFVSGLSLVERDLSPLWKKMKNKSLPNHPFQ